MDNAILEVVLGLVLVYLVLALLVSKLQEVLAGQLFRGRPKYLHKLVREATGHDENLKQAIFNNPMVFALSLGDDAASEKHGQVGQTTGPSSIPPELFARVLLIELNDDKKGGHPASRYASPTAFVSDRAPGAGGGSAVGGANTWRTLRGLLTGHEADWPGFEAQIAGWFSHIGDRSEGWYQRRSQNWSLGLAFALAALLNVDSFFIADRLSSDPDLRRSLASLAERVNTLFPGGVPAPTPAAGSNAAAAAAAASDKPEVRVVASLVDAITRLNQAFFKDASLANYRPNQQPLTVATATASAASAGDQGKAAKPQSKGTAKAQPTQFCREIDTIAIQPSDRIDFRSNPATWLLGLPQLLAYIEHQQVSKSPVGDELMKAHKCLTDVSVWVRSASVVSGEPDVRALVQDAAVALESAKSALREMIENQRPDFAASQLYLMHPEMFVECAVAPGTSLTSLRACVARGVSGQVRLPLGPFATNLRQQFCTVVPSTGQSAQAGAPNAVLSATLPKTSAWPCAADRFDGRESPPLRPMALAVKGPGAFVAWAIGCLVTAFFVALGAPFWFDVLGKVVNLRAAGRKRDAQDDQQRGQGTSPIAPSGAAGAKGTAPFNLARNGFEEQLIPADIVAVQRQLGVTATGVLDGPTRTAIAGYTRQQGLTATDELSFLLYDHIVGRSPTSVAITRPDSLPVLGRVHANVQPLVKNLETMLGFDGRIDPLETRYTADLRALAVLYRYKREMVGVPPAPPVAPQDRAVVKQARNDPAALSVLGHDLMTEILSFIGVPAAALGRDHSAPWLDWALGELGQVEANKPTRADSNLRVMEYLDSAAGSPVSGGDNTAWCAAFVAWVLNQHNRLLPRLVIGPVRPCLPPPTAALQAANWSGTTVPPNPANLAWGMAVAGVGAGVIGTAAEPGDVVTLKLAPSTTINHVAFVLALEPAVAGVVPGLWALGGNQSGSGCVCVSYFEADKVADIRRPQ